QPTMWTVFVVRMASSPCECWSHSRFLPGPALCHPEQAGRSAEIAAPLPIGGVATRPPPPPAPPVIYRSETGETVSVAPARSPLPHAGEGRVRAAPSEQMVVAGGDADAGPRSIHRVKEPFWIS